jgi:hypothetical protein
LLESSVVESAVQGGFYSEFGSLVHARNYNLGSLSLIFHVVCSRQGTSFVVDRVALSCSNVRLMSVEKRVHLVLDILRCFGSVMLGLCSDGT